MANEQTIENVAVEPTPASTKKKGGRPKKEVPVEVKEEKVEKEQPVEASDKAVPVDLVKALGDANPTIKLSFPTGKKPQVRKSPICNPRNPKYDPKVAARRKKEKQRRKHNALMRRRGK